jgi:hypothetical protein
MKVRISSIVVICISLIIGLMFTEQSFAKINIQTLEGLWMFDDSKNPYKDTSGKGLDGKQNGNPKLVEGKFGNGVEFDGKSYITIPDHVNPTKAITITAWAKSTTATWNQNGWLIEKRDAYILHPVAGSLNMAFCTVNGGPWNLPKTWDAGQVGPKDITIWHMYTCTFDSTTGKWAIYIDGVSASTLDINKAELAPDKGPVHIGYDEAEAQRLGQGTVDEVAIFNVALSADDVKSLMNGFKLVSAVEPDDKLVTTWSSIKTKN